MPDNFEYATGGLVPGPKPGDPPLFRVVDPCMLGRFPADALRDSDWTITANPDGTWTLSRSRGKQYEEDPDV